MNENNSAEEWRPVPGFDGKYEVSNLGGVRSFKNPKMPGFSIKPSILVSKKGYKNVHLELWNGPTKKHFRLARLVWTVFKGSIPEGFHVDHIDNDQTNNRLDNLQLLSFAEYNRKRWLNHPRPRNHGGVRRKKVRCVETNMVYESVCAAEKAVDACHGNIAAAIKNPERTCRGFHWAYA